jgi:redox-sensing transcriptional repressor
VPEGVDVRKVDLSIELQILAFHAQRRSAARPADAPGENAGTPGGNAGTPGGRSTPRVTPELAAKG